MSRPENMTPDEAEIWLLERKKWLLDCGIGALDAQIWCCKKVIEITEAWE